MDILPIKQNVKRMADELRLKIHLASKDAKDKWDELKPKVREFEIRTEQETDKVTNDLAKVGNDLHAEMQKLIDGLKTEN